MIAPTQDPQTASLALTWLDANSWLIEMAGQRILLDPWLVGSLVFGGQEWFFRGDRPHDRAVPEGVDLILLSQGLPDHAHRRTLQQLPKSWPVVGSPSAAAVARELGFSSVTALAHGEIHPVADRLTIMALPGAPLGPLVQENAYLVTDLQTGQSLYYEPHGYPDASLAGRDPVDVAIVPLINQSILGVGTILQGFDTAAQVAQWLRPQVMLPTAGMGSIRYSGILANLLQTKGSPQAVQQHLTQLGIPTQVLEPVPGERVMPLGIPN